MNPYHPALLTFLSRVRHRTTTLRPEDLPQRRSLYRWHQSFGPALGYRPNVSLAALGVSHVHLFTPDNDHWRTCPLALTVVLVRDLHLDATLYLDCIIPTSMVAVVTEHLTTAGITHVVTGDAWQTSQDFGTWVEEDGRLRLHATPTDTPTPPRVPDSTPLLTTYPLLLPVAIESQRQRHSSTTLWHAITKQLGEHVWAYLPRRTRHYPTNGKHYVVRAQTLLEQHGLVRQYRVNYTPLEAHTIALVLLLPAGLELPTAVRDACLQVETSTGPSGSLVRLVGDTRLVHALTTTPLPGVRVYLRSHDLPTSSADYLYDPRTGAWRDPRGLL
jgi:hypothetical protein